MNLVKKFGRKYDMNSWGPFKSEKDFNAMDLKNVNNNRGVFGVSDNPFCSQEKGLLMVVESAGERKRAYESGFLERNI